MSSLQDRVWGTIDENTTETRRWEEARCRARWNRPCRKLRSGQNLDASPALTRENVYALQQNPKLRFQPQHMAGRLQLLRAGSMRGRNGAHIIEHPSLQQTRPALLQSMGVVYAQIITPHERQIYRQ